MDFNSNLMWKLCMIFGLFAIVFLIGCTQTVPSVNNTQPSMSCEQFCPTLSHVDCQGNWAISGTYPNCNCKFDCTFVPPQNETPQTNSTTNPPPQNQTNTTTSPPPNLPQKTVDQFLKDQLTTFKNDFLYTYSGTYTFSTYSWYASMADVPPNEIPLGNGRPYTDMIFDGRTYPSILGSALAYLVDKSTGETKKVGGMAIFKGNQSELDAYQKNEMNVKYANSGINKTAYGCVVSGKSYGKDSLGNIITLYVYYCRS